MNAYRHKKGKKNNKTFQIIQLKLYFKKGKGEHYERNIEEDL